LILAGMMLALFLAALDQTIVATAAPSVVSALGVFNLFAWVFATYMLASTAVTPIAGKLSDTYGRRWVYLIGVTIFMVGSAMSGASQSMEWLIFSRGMQGLGAGALFPVSMATIADLYPPAKRGKVQGLFAAVFGVSSIIGPTAGGYLVDNVSWRWIFYVNLPTGLLALVVLFLAMRDTAPHGPRPTIDYLGAAVLTAAITTTLLIIIWGGSTYEWLSAPIIGMGVGAVALWVLAWVVESRAESPILPVAFFKVQVFTVSMISRLFIGGGMFGAILFIPLYVQVVIGSSATDSGLVLTPMMLGIVFASGISGFALSRFKRYKYLTFVGILLMIGGFYLLKHDDAGNFQRRGRAQYAHDRDGLGHHLPAVHRGGAERLSPPGDGGGELGRRAVPGGRRDDRFDGLRPGHGQSIRGRDGCQLAADGPRSRRQRAARIDNSDGEEPAATRPGERYPAAVPGPDSSFDVHGDHRPVRHRARADGGRAGGQLLVAGSAAARYVGRARGAGSRRRDGPLEFVTRRHGPIWRSRRIEFE
jgi:EmrB/QacA subfamily drug resistance transporter